jgi:hypothetical protein
MGQRRNLKGNYEILRGEWNKDTIHQNVWDTINAVVRSKLIVINSNIKKQVSNK